VPRVPRLNQDEAQPQTRAFANVKQMAEIPDEAFGGGEGVKRVNRAVQGLGQTVQKYQEDERARADQTRLLEERRALNDWEVQSIYDPEKGAINRRGKDALGLPDELDQSFSKFVQEREKSLNSDTQRMAFRQLVDARKAQVNQWTSQHVGQQMKIVEEAEFGASLESSKERASINPANIPLESNFLKQQVMTKAQREGWGPEQTNTELRKHDTDLHTRYISRLLSEKNGMAAKDYFASVKDRLDPDAAAKLQPAIDEVFRRGEGQRISDELVGRYGTGALEQAKKIKDPELRDETAQRVKAAIADQEYAKNVAQERTFESAYSIVEKSRNLDDVAHMWTSLSPDKKEKLQAFVNKGPDVTDRDTYEEIKLGLANPETRSKYLQMDMNEFRHKLSNSDFQEIVKDKVALMKDDPKVKTKLDGFLTDQQAVDGLLTEANIKPKSDQGIKFKRKLDQLVLQHQDKTGKKVTNEELRRLGNTLLLEGVTHKGWIWDTTQRVFELESGQSFEEIEVPTEDAELIAKELKKRGRQVTQDAIVKYYIKGKTKGG
jgi:succinate dehydrogenase flavin-adding protein (antitoxin of CptAB toxin-antitoxin module)